MVFPVISKFNAELVKKKSVSCCARETMSNISQFLSTPGQVTPRQTHLTVYACPSYQ